MSSVCEICSSSEELSEYKVEPKDETVVVCSTCKSGLEDVNSVKDVHWNCLNDSMWSESSAVKVVTFRVLSELGRQDLLDMMYLEEDEKSWAESGVQVIEDIVIHKDSNGVTLSAGDTVTIIKDLEVKGAGFTAKRGTAVRNISLTSNPEQIEGRVNGVKIVLLTCFLKKS